MSKFNKTKEPVSPTTVNEMGEKAYQLSDKEELVSIVLTTFLSNSYYETEKEIIDRIKEKVAKLDPLFVAKLAIYARNEANMRSVSHLLAGELANKVSGKEWAKRFYEKIVGRPDDMSEILAYYSYINGGKLFPLQNAIKKGFRKKLESLDAYQLDKYKMTRKNISMVDLIKILHPTPNKGNAEAYKRLIEGKSLSGLYESKILEKELSKAGVAQDNKTVEEAKEEAIESVLGNIKGMPIFNLVRNLRNILLHAPNSVEEACKQLTNETKIKNSRLLPFRFASAYSEIERVGLQDAVKSKKLVVFEEEKVETYSSKEQFDKNVSLIKESLEKAIEISCQNIPVFEGNTAVLIDHSGSVRGDAGSSSNVSAFSKTKSAMIGNLFGSMLAYSQNNTYIGLFGDKLISVPIDRKIGVLEFNAKSFEMGENCGGGTENGLYTFLRECIVNRTKVDNLVIFSDMVIGSGGSGGWDSTSSVRLGEFQRLFTEFKKINPLCLTTSVNIRDTRGKSVFDRSLNVVQVSGWSDKIFDIIGTHKVGYKELIKKIENIGI